MGPFVDATHPKIRAGEIDVSLDDLFKSVPRAHGTTSHRGSES